MPTYKLLTLETNKYDIKISNFEGPLDLLCHLIEKNKMDIFDVKISKITDQYIQYINEMEKLNLEVTSEFIVMATTLLYLKSKTLLPKDTEDTEELTEEELLQRIADYKKYKDISCKLSELFDVYNKRFFKEQEEIEFLQKPIAVNYDLNSIAQSYRDVLKKNKQKINKKADDIKQIAITESYTVENKVKDMYRELIHNDGFVFNKLFKKDEHNKNEVVTAFSGLLEMSRRSKVTTKQEELFGDITVKKNRKRVKV